MTTIAEALKSYLQATGGSATSEQIKTALQQQYPDQWKTTAIQAHLYGCAVNNPKAYRHNPYAPKFLYKNSDGSYELYAEQRHGPNEWVPPEEDDETGDEVELAETTISLERDLEDHLVKNLDAIEKGLKLVGRQFSTEVGRIDILAEDEHGGRVVIEVKVGDAKDSSIGQIARYLGWFAYTDGKPARGILIAAEFSTGVRYAAASIPNLTLLAYHIHFTFERATI